MLRNFEEYKIKTQDFSNVFQAQCDRLDNKEEAPAFSRYNLGIAFEDAFCLDARVFSSKLQTRGRFETIEKVAVFLHMIALNLAIYNKHFKIGSITDFFGFFDNISLSRQEDIDVVPFK